jgi:hypothetical protein
MNDTTKSGDDVSLAFEADPEIPPPSDVHGDVQGEQVGDQDEFSSGELYEANQAPRAGAAEDSNHDNVPLDEGPDTAKSTAETDSNCGDSLDEDGSDEEPESEEPEVDSPQSILSQLECQVGEEGETLQRAEVALRTAERRLATLERQLSRSKERSLTAVAEVEALRRSRDQLATWLRERSRSMAVRLLLSLEEDGAALASDEEQLRAFSGAATPNLAPQARSLRRSFVRGLWIALGLAAGITLAVYGVALLLERFGQQMPGLGTTWWAYLILFFSILFVGVATALKAYHREWARLKRVLDLELMLGEHLLKTVDHLRRERARIDALFPQVRERLEMLGLLLHHPWREPEGQLGGGMHTPSIDTLPACLQVFRACDDDVSALAGSRAIAVASQIKRGWRKEAAESLMDKVAQRQGLPPDALTMRALNGESSETGLRRLVSEWIQDPFCLDALARERIVSVAREIQDVLSASAEDGASLDAIRPAVEPVDPDPLEGLRLSHELLQEERGRSLSWLQAQQDICGDGTIMSRTTLSSVAVAAGRLGEFESVVAARGDVAPILGKSVDTANVHTDRIVGVDITTRIDITPPVRASEVVLFEEAAVSDDRSPGVDYAWTSPL